MNVAFEGSKNQTFQGSKNFARNTRPSVNNGFFWTGFYEGYPFGGQIFGTASGKGFLDGSWMIFYLFPPLNPVGTLPTQVYRIQSSVGTNRSNGFTPTLHATYPNGQDMIVSFNSGWGLRTASEFNSASGTNFGDGSFFCSNFDNTSDFTLRQAATLPGGRYLITSNTIGFEMIFLVGSFNRVTLSGTQIQAAQPKNQIVSADGSQVIDLATLSLDKPIDTNHLFGKPTPFYFQMSFPGCGIPNGFSSTRLTSFTYSAAIDCYLASALGL